MAVARDTMSPVLDDVLRLLGGLFGIAALIAVLGVLISAGMWLVLLAVRHVTTATCRLEWQQRAGTNPSVGACRWPPPAQTFPPVFPSN